MDLTKATEGPDTKTASALGRRGRNPKLDAAGELALVALLRANPTATMRELAQTVLAELGVVLGEQALRKALQRQGRA